MMKKIGRDGQIHHCRTARALHEPPRKALIRATALRCVAYKLGCFVGRQKQAPAHAKILLEEKRLVGTGRFELPTPRTPSECSTRLSHVPTGKTGPASGEVNHSILHHSCCASTGLDRRPSLPSIFASCRFVYAQALP